MSAYYLFRVDQGTTWTVSVLVKDADGPVDLSGYTARLQIRESIESPLPLVSLTSAPGEGITIDGPPGLISWTIADEITAGWSWRHGVHSLEIESPGGHTRRLLKGEVLVDPEVVR